MTGPLDSAARQLPNDETTGIPVVLPIEMKKRGLTIYTIHSRISPTTRMGHRGSVARAGLAETNAARDRDEEMPRCRRLVSRQEADRTKPFVAMIGKGKMV